MKKSLLYVLSLCTFLLWACQPAPMLSVSPESLSFTSEGGSQTIQITANNAWTAIASSSDFSVSPSSGEGNATLTVTCKPAVLAEDLPRQV